MDAKQDQHPPMQGDDELAKALQGGLQFEETPVPGDQQTATTPAPAAPSPAPAMPDPLDEPPTLGMSLPQPEDSELEETPTVQKPHDTKDEPKKTAVNATAAGSSGLDKLKASALEELRPLVSKLSLPADEKFDTLLLIIRSTDDQSLLDEAHAAAKEITDDTKRAQALLDIIKEIDYFSTKR